MSIPGRVWGNGEKRTEVVVKIGNVYILTNFKHVLLFSLGTKLKFRMCTKTNLHNKFVVGIAIMTICVGISASLYFGYGGGAKANMEINGEKNKSIFWSCAQYAVVFLVFVLFLKCTHYVTSKVARIETQVKDLNKHQSDVVIIPF